MHREWARSIRDQCLAAGVGFNLKGWGEWWPSGQFATEAHLRLLMRADERISPDGRVAYRLGRRLAGRLLDGTLHDGWVK
jgi:hypothetical protein